MPFPPSRAQFHFASHVLLYFNTTVLPSILPLSFTGNSDFPPPYKLMQNVTQVSPFPHVQTMITSPVIQSSIAPLYSSKAAFRSAPQEPQLLYTPCPNTPTPRTSHHQHRSQPRTLQWKGSLLVPHLRISHLPAGIPAVAELLEGRESMLRYLHLQGMNYTSHGDQITL